MRQPIKRDRKSKAKKAPPARLAPAGIGAKSDVELNEAIAIYNQTGNYIALWSALEICLRSRRSIPEDVGQLFHDMAQRLVGLARDKIPRAREYVADIVLGTSVSGGGPSVFQEYRKVVADRRRLSVVNSLISTHIVGKPQALLFGSEQPCGAPGAEGIAWTLTQVFEAAGRKLNSEGDLVTVEALKRLHEQADQDAGVFKTNAIVRANKKGGIVEVEPIERPGGEKSAKSKNE